MTKRMKWDTVHLVPPTPFTSDGKHVDADQLGALVETRIQRGIRVVIPAAGTGEFHSLTVEESTACIKAVLNVGHGRAAVLAPIGLGLEHALAIGEIAMNAGADGVLVMPPVHPYLSDSGVKLYFEAIYKALKTTLWVYKRGPYPSNECLAELISSGVVTGVKYAVNDLNALSDFIEKTDSSSQVVCGTAERNAPFFHLAGARGFTSGVAMLFPELSLQLHAALTSQNYSEAMHIRSILNPFELFRARHADSLNISTIKAGMEIIGESAGPVRPPNRPLTLKEMDELQLIIQSIQRSKI